MDDRVKEERRELVGICGIYCGTCTRYLAPRIQGDGCLNQTSGETGYSAEEMR